MGTCDIVNILYKNMLYIRDYLWSPKLPKIFFSENLTINDNQSYESLQIGKIGILV